MSLLINLKLKKIFSFANLKVTASNINSILIIAIMENYF